MERIDGLRADELTVSPESEAKPFQVRWHRRAEEIELATRSLYLASRDPRTPWYAKAVALFVAAYLVSPVQLLPNFLPVVGYLDDFLVAALGIRLAVRMTPPAVLAECRERARAETDLRSLPARAMGLLAFATLGAVLATALWLAIRWHHGR